jgi:hypothetical protein
MNADRPDSRPEDPDHGLDIDAAFAEIVANWNPDGDAETAPGATGESGDGGATPVVGDARDGGGDARDPGAAPDATGAPAPAADDRPGEPDQDSLASLFRPAWQEPPRPAPSGPTSHPDARGPLDGDGLNTGASWDDEGHFVPPPPPPLPPVDPRRKAAWTALLGSPVAAMLLILLDVVIPGWVSVFLVAAFVGGFGYLVATMRSSAPDDWSGDDGAVV